MLNTLHLPCTNLPTSSYYKYRFELLIDEKHLTQYFSEFTAKQALIAEAGLSDKQAINTKPKTKTWQDFVEGESPLNLPRDLQQLLNFGYVATVIQCDCGQPECWSISTHVDCIGDYVTWSRFNHFGSPNKNQSGYVNYSQLPVFTFDKKQYLAEIAQALATEQQEKYHWVRK